MGRGDLKEKNVEEVNVVKEVAPGEYRATKGMKVPKSVLVKTASPFIELDDEPEVDPAPKIKTAKSGGKKSKKVIDPTDLTLAECLKELQKFESKPFTLSNLEHFITLCYKGKTKAWENAWNSCLVSAIATELALVKVSCWGSLIITESIGSVVGEQKKASKNKSVEETDKEDDDDIELENDDKEENGSEDENDQDVNSENENGIKEDGLKNKISWFHIVKTALESFFEGEKVRIKIGAKAKALTNLAARRTAGGVKMGKDTTFSDAICSFLVKLFYSSSRTIKGYGTSGYTAQKVLGDAIWAGHLEAIQRFPGFFKQKLVLLSGGPIVQYPYAERAPTEEKTLKFPHEDPLVESDDIPVKKLEISAVEMRPTRHLPRDLDKRIDALESEKETNERQIKDCTTTLNSLLSKKEEIKTDLELSYKLREDRRVDHNLTTALREVLPDEYYAAVSKSTPTFYQLKYEEYLKTTSAPTPEDFAMFMENLWKANLPQTVEPEGNSGHDVNTPLLNALENSNINRVAPLLPPVTISLGYNLSQVSDSEMLLSENDVITAEEGEACSAFIHALIQNPAPKIITKASKRNVVTTENSQEQKRPRTTGKELVSEELNGNLKDSLNENEEMHEEGPSTGQDN